MDSERLDLRSSLKALAAEARRNLGVHLEPEQLLAYRAGELSAAVVEQVRDHLTLCPECAELLLDLDDLGRLDESPSEAISDRDVETAWLDVRKQLAEEGRLALKGVVSSGRPGASESPAPLPFARPERRQLPGLAYALAASLVACVGLSSWVGVLLKSRPDVILAQRQQRMDSEPLIAAVTPVELRTLRSGEDTQEVHPGKSPSFTISFRLPETVNGSYRVELSLEGQAGKPLGKATNSGRGGELVQFRISRQGLVPGRFQIRIFPEGKGQGDAAAEMKFRLAAE